ncbi:TRAP transporter substrate-binding protein DctP [Chloroflexota bacterium]
MRKALYCVVTVVLVAGLLLGCSGPDVSPSPSPSPEPKPEPIVIKAVSFISKNDKSFSAFALLRDRVNERANGELIINYLGASEVVSPKEQGVAVGKGVVDMAFLPARWYPELAPGAEALLLAEITPAEERARGAYDFINDLHMKGGLFYLGRTYDQPGRYFYLFTNKQVKTPRDLASLKMTNAHQSFDSLGITYVSVRMPEIYTALERGLADGQCSDFSSATAFSWQEVLKYVVDHPFNSSNVVTIMNLNTWNSIPKHLQTLIMDVQVEVEKESASIIDQFEEESRQQIEEAGLEFVKFSADDERWFYETLREGQWSKLIEMYPEVGTKLKELLVK